MNRMLKALGLVTLLVLSPAMWHQAEAEPVLQLDMAGGTYDPITQTIVADGGPFTLFAILTPQEGATQQEINRLLNTTYYISVALTPQIGPTDSSLGSFTFGQDGTTPSLVNATSDMTYGVPPVEALESLQGWDSGDLSQHSIYPTFFSEFTFTFSGTQTSGTYNTADDPGGPIAGTGSYYIAFQGDSTLLNGSYQLHFDLYDTVIRTCLRPNGNCTDGDIDRDRFAPFSHDAETRPSVPEPGSALLMLVGLVGAGGFARHRGSNRGNRV